MDWSCSKADLGCLFVRLIADFNSVHAGPDFVDQDLCQSTAFQPLPTYRCVDEIRTAEGFGHAQAMDRPPGATDDAGPPSDPVGLESDTFGRSFKRSAAAVHICRELRYSTGQPEPRREESPRLALRGRQARSPVRSRSLIMSPWRNHGRAAPAWSRKPLPCPLDRAMV